MALIYTDTNLVDQGYLSGASFDFQEEANENSFSLGIGIEDYQKLSAGCYVYDEDNPQFGGRLERIRINTLQKSIIWEGKTFSGILSTKIIEPYDAGETAAAYRTITGTLQYKIDNILALVGLENVFYTNSNSVGNTPTEWQIDRYTDVLTAFRKLAETNGLSMRVAYKRNHVGQKLEISFSGDNKIVAGETYDSDLFEFDISEEKMPVNHLICLGAGNLASRDVYHLYLKNDKLYYRIKNNTTVHKVDDGEEESEFLSSWSSEKEIAAVYDYPNVESYDELRKEGLKHFQELLDNGTKFEITPPEEVILNIGDVIAGKERISGIYVEKEVKKIIYKTHDDIQPSITYETTETKGR